MLTKNITQPGTVIKVGDVEIHVLEISARMVRVGIEAPREMKIEHDTYLRSDLGRGRLPTSYRRTPDPKDL